MTITNGATGIIYGGGGGGGGGGKGADGVAGQNAIAPRTQYGEGYGWYIVTVRENQGATVGLFSYDNWVTVGYKTFAFWNGQYVMDVNGLHYSWTLSSTDMAGTYNQKEYIFSYGDDTTDYTDVYAIQRNNATWYGGKAGIGGAGGAGAPGRGSTNLTSALTGGVGAVGTAGTTGENNAIGTTNGTAGENGLTGGAGGEWGQSGAASAAPGGAAGPYLVKGTASVTLTNNATADAIIGTLA